MSKKLFVLLFAVAVVGSAAACEPGASAPDASAKAPEVSAPDASAKAPEAPKAPEVSAPDASAKAPEAPKAPEGEKDAVKAAWYKRLGAFGYKVVVPQEERMLVRILHGTAVCGGAAGIGVAAFRIGQKIKTRRAEQEEAAARYAAELA